MSNLVVGASGQVGSVLRGLVGGIGTYGRHAQPGLVPLDLRDPTAIRALVRSARPEVCYLPAAWTHMDAAEADPVECRRVNVESIGCFAKEIRTLGGVLVFFSTDHVFGERDALWREEESVAPLSVYARCKVEAEEMVRAILPDRHLIVRTSWVFGPDPQGKNFVCRVRDTLGRGEVLTAPNDQWGQPTYGPDLARTVVDLVSREIRGTYHLVGPRWLTRLEWARTVAVTLGLDASRIEGHATTTGRGAPRPRRVGLDTGKMTALLGTPIRPPEAGLRP